MCIRDRITLTDLKGNKSTIKIPIIKGDLTNSPLKNVNSTVLNTAINNKLDYNFEFENAEIKIAFGFTSGLAITS